MIFTGLLKSEKIRNKTSLRRSLRELEYSLTPKDFAGLWTSMDFDDYYAEHVRSKQQDPTALKKALLDLFDLEGRFDRGELSFPCDIQGSFTTARMETQQDLFYGCFDVEILFYVIENDLDRFADQCCDFGMRLSEKYRNINIRVDLNASSPCTAPYSEHYGRFPVGGAEILQESLFKDYMRHLYISEVGWGHIVCGKTRGLAECPFAESDPDALNIREIGNGAVFIRPKNPLSKVTISDLKQIKKYLYPVIMPRSEEWSFPGPFRKHWEAVPVFEKELTVTENTVTFRHFGQIDPNKACQAMNLDLEKLERFYAEQKNLLNNKRSKR